jgi:hypothetical protein
MHQLLAITYHACKAYVSFILDYVEIHHNKENLTLSRLTFIRQRPDNGPTAACFDLTAHIMSGSDEDIGIQLTRLQMLHEEVSSYEPDSNHQDIASQCSLETHEAVRAFYKKIDALNSVLPSTIQDNSKLEKS